MQISFISHVVLVTLMIPGILFGQDDDALNRHARHGYKLLEKGPEFTYHSDQYG